MIVTIKCFDTACGGANGDGGNYISFDANSMPRDAAEAYLDGVLDQGWVVDDGDMEQALYGFADVEIIGQCPTCASMAGA